MSRAIGLGRGLDALLGNANISAKEISGAPSASGGGSAPFGLEGDITQLRSPSGNADEVLQLDPHLLDPNPEQPRREFDAQAMQELSDSIKEHGIVQPIIAEKAESGRYRIVAGERRTRAAIMAGLLQVPVLLRTYDEEKRLEIALIENIQRADLNPIDEAAAYQKLMAMGNLSQEELAARVGKKRSTVANAMRLLLLSDEIKASLRDGTITPGHARALLSVEDEAARQRLFKRIIDEKLNVRDAEKAAKIAAESLLGKQGVAKNGGKGNTPPRPANKMRDSDIAAIEQLMLEKQGTKCKINGTLEKGKIEIDYYSRVDLDRLCALLTGGQPQ